MSVATILTSLNADSALNAIVSNRIYRTKLPNKATYPAIVFNVSHEVENTLAGESSIKNYSFEIEIYGPNYVQLESILTELKRVLTTDSGYQCVCVSVADDSYQDELKNYSIFADFSIWI